MKKQAAQLQNAAGKTLKVAGMRLDEINSAEDLERIGLEQIEKAKADLMKKDRADKIRQRKQEGKRTDHLARAIREEERSAIEVWSEDIVEQDEELYKFHEKKKN